MVAIGQAATSSTRRPIAREREGGAWAGIGTAVFLLGQNAAGRWVVRDSSNRRGGLFFSKAGALKYIRDETRAQGCAVLVVCPLRGLD